MCSHLKTIAPLGCLCIMVSHFFAIWWSTKVILSLRAGLKSGHKNRTIPQWLHLLLCLILMGFTKTKSDGIHCFHNSSFHAILNSSVNMNTKLIQKTAQHNACDSIFSIAQCTAWQKHHTGCKFQKTSILFFDIFCWNCNTRKKDEWCKKKLRTHFAKNDSWNSSTLMQKLEKMVMSIRGTMFVGPSHGWFVGECIKWLSWKHFHAIWLPILSLDTNCWKAIANGHKWWMCSHNFASCVRWCGCQLISWCWKSTCSKILWHDHRRLETRMIHHDLEHVLGECWWLELMLIILADQLERDTSCWECKNGWLLPSSSSISTMTLQPKAGSTTLPANLKDICLILPMLFHVWTFNC